MEMSPYLSFKGDCEAAFAFYAQCLGGELGEIYRYPELRCRIKFRPTGNTK